MNGRRIILAGLTVGLVAAAVGVVLLAGVKLLPTYPRRKGSASRAFVLPAGEPVGKRAEQYRRVLAGLGLKWHGGHGDGGVREGPIRYGAVFYRARGTYRGHRAAANVVEMHCTTPGRPNKIRVRVTCTALSQAQADRLAKMLFEDFLRGITPPTTGPSL